ncbi:MAG: 50S ribosomal protein L4 [Candidatus Pacebacteria bacterium]|nr:50S ribosomal protein L4 [Candidatus Paceibacterota bacterium]MDD4333628.1 50S ribosomal protein L4 [Candidatus Paceibacterota bacterium]
MKTLTNTEIKKILNKEIFEVPMNDSLVHQIVTSQMSNRRQVLANTKTRAEVSGSGKKPWRQKGTGKARHGSIRSPLWIGGGVTFGPRSERNFKKDVPKKMKRKALFMVLSDKLKSDTLIIVDSFDITEIKTKTFKEMISKLNLKGSMLIALEEVNENVIKSARNIEKVDTIQAKDLNCLDIMNHKYLVTTEKAIEKIKETFLSEK